jgi:hypothetical protein
MTERDYRIRISPEVINGDIRKVNLFTSITGVNFVTQCCVLVPEPVEIRITGSTYVYSSMTDILSGGTDGSSLLTGLTIPILLTENVNDIGYYSIFDGMVLQQDTMLNFVFSGSNYSCSFYNTSDIEFKKYLEFSTYKVDWGDGSSPESVTSSIETHTYPSNSTAYTITMSGMSPWGTNIIKKTINLPLTGVTIDNPRGTATFTPAGGNWSATSFSYNYIFSGDANCNSTVDDIRLFNTGNFFPFTGTSIPFLITGYTQSSLRDLKQYGSIPYKPLESVTANTGAIGMYSGVSDNGLYTRYTINDIDYYDYSDGTTLFVAYSSGLTSDMVVCQPIVKNELLLGIIDEPEVQSNIFIERGKNSALERIERLGEVDNIGDLEKYGYKFFNVINTI